MRTPDAVTALLDVHHDGAEAPYEQVRRQLAAAVDRGDLEPGTRLPSVRALAAALGLAANTVARSYRELEADGVVETHGRAGTVVAPRALDADTRQQLEQAAQGYVALARRHGLSRAEGLRVVEESWGPRGPHDAAG